MPDNLIAFSEVSRRTFLDRGLPDSRVVAGGSLRFANLTANEIFEKPIDHPCTKEVLCCLGMEFDPAVELACKAIEAINRLPEWHLTINFHPLEDTGPIKKKIRQVFETKQLSQVSFSSERVGELMKQSTAILYNTSGASIEALFGNKPVIFVGRDYQIDYNKLPSDASILCKNSDEIASVIANLENRVEEATPSEMMDKYLMPVNEKIFLDAASPKA